MNDDPFLRGMSKTQKTGFNYGNSQSNFASVDPNTFGGYTDDLINNRIPTKLNDTNDLDQSYNEPHTYRPNDQMN